MVDKKSIRERGKLRLSRYFQKFSKGDKVGVIKEVSISSYFPERLQGRTGVVEEKRGGHYLVDINDLNKKKQFLIAPVHLKKIK